MSEMVLQPIEICALFSNLLDNAIEANQKLPSGQERWINLSCIRKNKILVISLSNAQERTTETVRHEMPETTKADKKQHGFGLRSVNRVIKAYDGYMEIEMHEGKFSIVAYLNGFDGC
jgi:sensor histidine kinase regulating citrate/malate metabolism